MYFTSSFDSDGGLFYNCSHVILGPFSKTNIIIEVFKVFHKMFVRCKNVSFFQKCSAFCGTNKSFLAQGFCSFDNFCIEKHLWRLKNEANTTEMQSRQLRNGK